MLTPELWAQLSPALVTQGFSGQSCGAASSDSAGHVSVTLCASLGRRYFWFPHSRGTAPEIPELCQAFATAGLEARPAHPRGTVPGLQQLMGSPEIRPGPVPTTLGPFATAPGTHPEPLWAPPPT